MLNEISTFDKHKTLLKKDFELYSILINRLLKYENLSFIKGIIKIPENSQISEKKRNHRRTNLIE